MSALGRGASWKSEVRRRRRRSGTSSAQMSGMPRCRRCSALSTRYWQESGLGPTKRRWSDIGGEWKSSWVRIYVRGVCAPYSFLPIYHLPKMAAPAPEPQAQFPCALKTALENCLPVKRDVIPDEREFYKHTRIPAILDCSLCTVSQGPGKPSLVKRPCVISLARGRTACDFCHKNKKSCDGTFYSAERMLWMLVMAFRGKRQEVPNPAPDPADWETPEPEVRGYENHAWD